MNDRKTDDLLNAIGALPDFLIDESAEGSEEMKNRNITKWATVAAVFVFVALTCVIFAIHGNSAVVTPSNTDNAASESEETSAPESDTAAESTSAPESTSEPETTETDQPEEPEITSMIFRLRKSVISFPVVPKSERTKNMLANGNLLDAEDEKTHSAVYSVHTVDDYEFLKKDLLSPEATKDYVLFGERSPRFDEEFFSENTLYISFVEAPEYGGAKAEATIRDSGDTIEISFGFTQFGDFTYSTEPYCIFLTVPNSRADNLTTVDCICENYDHIATVKGVVTEISEDTTTLRLLDEERNLFSDAGTVTLGFVDSRLKVDNAVEIVYDDRTVGNSNEHIEEAISFRMLEMGEFKLPETVGTVKGTGCFVDTKEGYDLMRNSELNINRNSTTFERSVFGIGSASEFASFRKLLADAAVIDPQYSFDDEYVAEYDETFFKSHSLLIIYSTKSDSAYRLIPCKAEYGEDGIFTVGICCVNPSVGLGDEAASCIFITVEKEELSSCSGVSVEYVNVSA